MTNGDEQKKNAEVKRITDIRDKTIHIIQSAQNSQELHWNNLRTQIEAATNEFTGRQHQLLWDGLQKIANSNSYPLWMDIIFSVAAAVLPVNAIIAYIGQKILFSTKLLGFPFVKDKSGQPIFQDILVVNPKGVLAPLGGLKIQESYENWVSVGQLFGPEVVANFRAIIRTASQMAARPLFSNEQMTNWMTKSQKPSRADNTGLPSVDVLREMSNWINKSLFNDKEILNKLDLKIKEESNKLLSNEENILLDPKKAKEKREKEVFMEEIQKFIYEEAGLTQIPGQGKSSPKESFQRFVEACLWCTSYDFTPQLVPAVHVTPKNIIPAHFRILPFSDAFWDNLISRHYDPFFQDGSKTYKEIGFNRYIAHGDLFTPLPNIVGSIPPSYPEPSPAHRLSFQWSMVLAPALLNENSEVTARLEKLLP